MIRVYEKGWRRDRQLRVQRLFQRSMTTLRIILVLFRGASIVFAVFSVYYWFRASTVTITDADKRYDPKFDFVVNDPDHKADDN